MALDNPFAVFMGKRTFPAARSSLKRERSVEVIDDSPLSSRTATAMSNAGSPNAADSRREALYPAAATPPVPSSPAKAARPLRDEDDEEAELRLLLGIGKEKRVEEKEKKERVEEKEKKERVAAAATSATDRRPREAHAGSAGGVEMRSLPWATRSNSVLEDLANRFDAHFRWEIQRNASLVAVYDPFFRDRVLERLQSDVSLRRQFTQAPIVTSADTGAMSGYVLRPYQVEGVQFLLDHFHRGMSCILADDMGLGKTAQIASFLHTLKVQHGIEGPHLIVAPLSTLTGWTREFAHWAPSLRVVKYYGERNSRAALRTGRASRHCVFVTTPSVLGQDRGFFRRRPWVVAVVDEAHVLKGRDTRITTIARKLTACFRLAVTGTPVHNAVGEVWSLMGFLYPSCCARYEGNGNNNNNNNGNDPVEAAEDCARLLQQIMLRRTKGSLELGIPPRVDEPTALLEPTYVQRQLLARMTQQALRNDAEAASGARLHVSLVHQRVVCSHPLALRLLALEGRTCRGAGYEQRIAAAGIPMDEASIIAPSAKMIELDRMLRELKANGHRCLIFSNFTCVLDLVEGLCALRGYSHERLDGSTQRVERELSMIRFNAPGSDCFIFLLTTNAGGVGVTLTGADTVILFDSHFNPQIDRQAADRAHRIGQTRTVRVHRLCLRDTVEERIASIALRKASLGDFIVDGGDDSSNNNNNNNSNSNNKRKHSTTITTNNNNNTKSSSSSENNGGTESLSAERIRQLFQSTVSIDAAGRLSNSAPHSSGASSLCAAAADAAMVEELMRVGAAGGMSASLRHEARAGRPLVGVTHKCFACGEIMRPLEPLYHCAGCPKAFHGECVGARPLRHGAAAPRVWSCPRHKCSVCEKDQATDGTIFMCSECPLAFCFDCLDPRYFDLNEHGTDFVHIRRTYAGMEAEGMNVRQSVYYITCLRCCGVLSSSSSEADNDSESDGSDEMGEGSDENRTEDEGNNKNDCVEILDESD